MKCFIIRYPKNLVTDILLCLICSFVIMLILQNAETVGVVAVNGNNSEKAVSFLAENGLTVEEGSEKTDIIKIPEVFDDTLSDYNDLQKKQGFDLQNFAGKQVVRYSYELSDYLQQKNDVYFATVYFYNNKIIAADVYSTSVNGFMTGVIQDYE